MLAKVISAAAVVVTLAGCVGPLTKETASGFPTAALCQRYGVGLRNGGVDPLVSGELARRGIRLDYDQDKQIRERQIGVGAPLCQMYAAWGFPARENRTTTAAAVHIQHVYEITTRHRAYVYTENGVITAWQD